MRGKSTILAGAAIGALLAGGVWGTQTIVSEIQELRDQIEAASKPETPKSPLPGLDRELVEKLQQGGYTLFLRHGDRVHGVASTRLFDMAAHAEGMAPSDQSLEGYCLSSVGKESSRLLGQFIEKMNIPVGEVYASPLCRTLQTAALAFSSHPTQISESLSFLRHNYGSSAVKETHGVELKLLLSAPMPRGMNRVFVSHGNVLKHIGIDDTALEELGFIVLDANMNAIAITDPMAFSTLFYEMVVNAN